MPRRNGDSRERILEAAEILFSQHGYDKTSVDSIASASGVNKAVIYHHFESKAEIVRTIFERMLDRMELAGVGSGRRFCEMLVGGDGTPFVPGIRIMLMEALKSEGGDDALMEFALAVMEREHPTLKSLPAEECREELGRKFFAEFLPHILFVALRDRWCRFSGTSRETAEASVTGALLVADEKTR